MVPKIYQEWMIKLRLHKWHLQIYQEWIIKLELHEWYLKYIKNG